MMNSFWWGHSGAQNKGIHWLYWDKLSVHKNEGGMGFKNLTAFNLAMLSKQGWQLMTNHNSLVSRLFKARYFPHGSFLNSTLGHNPSFVWRSICNAKFIIRAGNRWCIGDGTTIPVLNENWLYDGSCLSLPTNNNSIVNQLCVSDIINPDEKSWNVPLVTSLFDISSADKILNTPLFSSVATDKQVWRVERDGHFSVKSAYRLCTQDFIDTPHLTRPGLWHLIWNLHTLPKVKNFLWRVCRNCLPTRVKLRTRGVNCPHSCVFCDAASEDSIHLFFLCRNSSSIWRQSKLSAEVTAATNVDNDAAGVIFNLLQRLNSADSVEMATILWSIWKQRNNKVWNNTLEGQNFVIVRAQEMVRDWTAVQHVQTHNSATPHATVIHRWKKPLPGRMKCNIDASFVGNKVGIGMCIRDDSGAFIRAKTEWFSPKCTVHVGEALGFLSALRWVHDLNLGPIDFELDSKIVVDSFFSSNSDSTEFGDIIKNCRTLFTDLYINSSVEFIRRQTNEVVHSLAKEATSLASFHV
jgi:hypothetical protein